MIDDTSMMYVKYNMKIDFITIVFHNKIEYELLKLQALSFAYVDVTLIHRILIVFNDVTQYKGFFNDFFFKEIMPYYPDSHKSMIQIMHLNELNLKIKYSDWFTQQAIKIIISKKIKTKYYITLDAKNHFIKNINSSFFFNENKKPILYYNVMEEEMLSYYKNCVQYFNVKYHYESNNPKCIPQTMTPYLLITQECKEFIEYIEKREKNTFWDFFLETQTYTEFYLYFTYLQFKKRHTLYHLESTKLMPLLTIGPQNPDTCIYNRWEHKLEIMQMNEILVMAFHRESIYVLNNEYKENILPFYKNIYGAEGEKIIKSILSL
jgi:hypothetical protein